MTVLVDGHVGAKCCAELRDTYCGLGRLKEIIEGMHDAHVREGAPPAFREIEEAYLLVREIYGEVERYLLPVMGDDSVFRTPDSDEPVCPV